MTGFCQYDQQTWSDRKKNQYANEHYYKKNMYFVTKTWFLRRRVLQVNSEVWCHGDIYQYSCVYRQVLCISAIQRRQLATTFSNKLKFLVFKP